MRIKLSKRVEEIQLSGIRQFMSDISTITDCISFTIGQPDFPTPTHVQDAAITAIQQQFTTYTPNAGDPRARKAATEFVQQKYGLDYDHHSEVMITVGASQAIDTTLRTLIEPGDEVLLPVPIYPGYEPIITQCGGKPVYIDTTNTAFKVTPEAIRAAINEKTKCIILPYPSNPTGVTLTKNELKAIADVVRQHSVMVIADEIYSELTYDQHHYSIASTLKDQTVVINGLSKSHAMTGWRIGLLFGPRWFMEQAIKVHQYTVSCASSISQAAAIEALTVGMNDAVEMREAYRNRRDYMEERLRQMGFGIETPGGAFYFFAAKPPFVQESSYEFCLEAANIAKVAMIPGTAFTSYGEGFVRLSYACSMETIEKGMDRLEGYLEKKKQENLRY